MLAARGLDEVGLPLGISLEGDVVILRIIVAVCYENAASCHCYAILLTRDIIIPFGIVWNGNYVIESDLTFHYQPKPVAAATEADFNLARDCEGKLLPNTANRYNAAELFVLAFFRS